MSYRGKGNPVFSAETFYHLVDTHHFFNIFMLTEVFYVNFFINEITASEAGPDIIRSHLFSPLLEYKFSSCNAVGSDGPVQSKCDSIYKSSQTSVKVITKGALKGIQRWTVPENGTYQ